jgi:4-diphosphocytidyl-2-C-methyl-D-erythritol kinase
MANDDIAQLPTVQVQCPAKVNLFLEITGKKRNGYHTLATLFAKVGVFDVVRVETLSDGFEFDIEDEVGQGLKVDANNLVLKAAFAFKKQYKAALDLRLTLIKRIPMGAGLGGGSSDAAGTLLALMRYYRMRPDRSTMATLKKLAVGLGADVPFFLRPEGICDGRGIGDKLQDLPTAKSLPWMILVFPGGAGVSTKEAYGRLRLPDKAGVLTQLSHLDTLKRKLEKGRPISEWGGLLFNRLEETVLGEHPEVQQAKDILTRAGLTGVLMSGSGSSVFGFASSREEGEAVLQRLKAYPWKVFLTSCLG